MGISFDEIAGINVERSITHGRGGMSYTYKVVAKLKDGQFLPFRSFSSSGSKRKENQARQLRDFIGVPEFDTTPPVLAALQSHAAEINESDGVHWQIQPLSGAGARWHSPDFKTEGFFLFIAQKADGQSSRGFLASLGSMFLKYALSIHGFSEGDTPGIEKAALLAPLDPSLEPYFMAFTNATNSSKDMLNPRAVVALADWARRHPLKQFQNASSIGQLVTLFGPNGVYVATLNLFQPEYADEVTKLGLELVKSQLATHAQLRK